MRIQTKPAFAHRANPDGTHDSICLCCYLTVGSADDESLLSKFELTHQCWAWRGITDSQWSSAGD